MSFQRRSKAIADFKGCLVIKDARTQLHKLRGERPDNLGLVLTGVGYEEIEGADHLGG